MPLSTYSENDDTGTMLPYRVTQSSAQASTLALPASRAGPSLAQEVSFLNGLTANGKVTSTSFWGDEGITAYKFGAPTAGTGATITYAFDAASGFTATEQATFLSALAMWESVADVHFVAASAPGSADILLRRGTDGGAYESGATTQGSGRTLGQHAGQSVISIDTSVTGFDLSGSFDSVAGYGIATITHEIGHALGLGHGGDYNGSVDPATDQYSVYDERMYTTMSYIGWYNTDAKYHASYPVTGTNWGTDSQGYYRAAPHTVMEADILAIQQLYGAAKDTQLDGGTVYGFNSNITGPLHNFFDFSVNTQPVVTLFNEGTGNTLDLSGWSAAETIDLDPGHFSSVGGLTNNLCIASDTRIDQLVCGGGNDTVTGNDDGDRISGGGGTDTLTGGAGDDTLSGGDGADILIGGAGQDTLTGGANADIFRFLAGDTGKSAGKADRITDFSHADGDTIDLSRIDAISGTSKLDAFTFIGTKGFDGHAGELRYKIKGGDTYIYADTDGDKRVDLTIRLDGSHALQAADFGLHSSAAAGTMAGLLAADATAIHHLPLWTEHFGLATGAFE